MHDIIGREKSYSLYGNGDNGSPAINIFMLLFCSATWYASLLGEPPALDPVQFGWEADTVNKCLIPQNMRKGTPYAPLHVLQLVRCGCESELSCRGGKCGCMGRQMPCTVFCACCGSYSICHNPFNKKNAGDDSLEDDD